MSGRYLFGCADFRRAFGALTGGVEQAVGRQYQMCFLGNAQDRVEVESFGFKSSSLLAEKNGVEHDTVADHIGAAAAGEYTRGNRAEHMLATVELEGMPALGPP